MNISHFLNKLFTLSITLLLLSSCTGEATVTGITLGAGGTTVSPIYPSQNNNDIPVNLTSIRVGVSGININSISQDKLTIIPSAPGSINIVSAEEFNYVFSIPLLANTTYTITLNGLASSTGTNVSPLSWNFTTGNAPPINRNTYYISPTGDDNNVGDSIVTPLKTFQRAFTLMTSGDELILLDGVYGTVNNTGGMHFDNEQYPNSKQIPSGINAQNPTLIRALNPGSVRINVPLFIGRSFRKDSFIKIQGIAFAGGKLFNSHYITIKDTGFNGAFSIGTNSHADGNDFNLIEDVWIWASQQRIIATNYRANNNIWRRVLIRGDGCNLLDKCKGSGNPNVGFTVYDSRDVSVQNMLIIDRVLNGGSGYADFATAQHRDSSTDIITELHPLGLNEWLGIMSVNSEDSSLVFEADIVIPNEPTWTIKNYLALGGKKSGVNIGFPFTGGATPNIFENITIHLSDSATRDGVRLAPGQNISTVRNIVSSNAGKFAFNSASIPSYVASYTPTLGDYNQKVCTETCLSDTTTFDIAIPYPLRIDATSPLNTTGFNNTNIGATVINRYGISGSHYGETNYNILTAAPLWPWPNEERIKNEMCKNTLYGFCADLTQLDGNTPQNITSYIWEFTGNPIPDNIYNP